jgi:Rrf2 family protein
MRLSVASGRADQPQGRVRRPRHHDAGIARRGAPGACGAGTSARRDRRAAGRFLDDILRKLRNSGIVRSQRGGEGGWLLARAPDTITVADVIRAVEGPLASVRGIRPHDLAAAGEQEPFVSLWIAVRASLRSVLEHVTLGDLAANCLPPHIAALAAEPDAGDAHDGRSR